MKEIKYIFLIFILFCTYCFSQKKQLLNEIPNDFNFEINDGGNDGYNSLYNNFYRTYSDSVSTVRVELTKDEKARIYSFMKKISFHKMPIEFIPIEKIKRISSSSFQISITIYYNKKKQFVSYNTGNTSDANEKRAKPFLEFYKMIWKIIYKKEKVKNLTESDINY